MLKQRNNNRAGAWVDRIAKKLRDDRYFNSLAKGFSSVDVPDVWGGSPKDAEELEATFIESIQFELDRPKPRRALLAQRLEPYQVEDFRSDAEIRSKLLVNANALFQSPDSRAGQYSDDDDDADD